MYEVRMSSWWTKYIIRKIRALSGNGEIDPRSQIGKNWSTCLSCEDNILTNIYTGYLPEGEKTLNAGGQVELDGFKSFKFVSNEEKELN